MLIGVGLPELRRGAAVCLTENLDKIAGISQPAVKGDVRYFLIGMNQHVGCALQPIML